MSLLDLFRSIKRLTSIIIILFFIDFVGSLSSAPENVTVTFINPTSIKITWQTASSVEKYDVTYKPLDTSYKVVAGIAGNSKAITIGGLNPETLYEISISAFRKGKKYQSQPIVFRTLKGMQQTITKVVTVGKTNETTSEPIVSPHIDNTISPNNSSSLFSVEYSNVSNVHSNVTTRELPTVRGVEIGIVLLVLFVWACAIALFFNRWGKIRMLLPYQPEYKRDQLKVPGTGATNQCSIHHSHQPLHKLSTEEIATRCQRARIHSAIFVSSEGKGFDSIEFFRRYGSQSILCRKAKSADNVTDRIKRFSDNKDCWDNADKESKKFKIFTSRDTESAEYSSLHGETSIKNTINPKKISKLSTLPTLSVSEALSTPLYEQDEIEPFKIPITS